jgi:hypothetical protein
MCTSGHAKIQVKIMNGYVCIISARLGFMTFYTEIHQENDSVVKYSR